MENSGGMLVKIDSKYLNHKKAKIRIFAPPTKHSVISRYFPYCKPFLWAVFYTKSEFLQIKMGCLNIQALKADTNFSKLEYQLF